MKLLLLAAFVTITTADVSHLVKNPGYQYQLSHGHNPPATSYGVPQGSILGSLGQGSAQGASLISAGLSSQPQQYANGVSSLSQFTLPSASGPSVNFQSGFSTPSPSGVDISSLQSGFSSPAPSVNFQSGFSTPSPGSVDISSLQSGFSSPAPSVNFQSGFSTPSPGSVDISSLQSGFSSPAPSVNFQNGFPNPSPSSIDISSGFASPAQSGGISSFQPNTQSVGNSVPSVNLVQYSQPSNFGFDSSSSFSNVGLSPLGSNQFSSDASLNSGSSFGSNLFTTNTGQGFDGSLVSKTSGGSLSDAFGVSTSSFDFSGLSGISGVSGTAGSHQPEVSKHLYFYAAPEDEEEIKPKVNIPQVAPKKTYKIIFIKAPTYRSQAAINIPAAPQNEEKTLVYVLVKKPEEQTKIHLESPEPTKPSKPEVFFIKYKTQKEAEDAVAQIQNKHSSSDHLSHLDHLSVQPEVGQSPFVGSVGLSGLGSVNTHGLSSFVGDSFSSTPASINFDVKSGFPADSQHEVSQEHVFVSGAAPSQTPVTFGQQSVDSFKVFGGGIGLSGGNSNLLQAKFGVGVQPAQESSTVAGVGSSSNSNSVPSNEDSSSPEVSSSFSGIFSSGTEDVPEKNEEHSQEHHDVSQNAVDTEQEEQQSPNSVDSRHGAGSSAETGYQYESSNPYPTSFKTYGPPKE